MIKSEIIDAKGTGKGVSVEDNALLITQFGCPPLIPQKNKVFRQYFTVDGTSSGSNDVGIDGSSTAVEFYIPACRDNDRYITKVSFLVSYGSGAEGWEFGDTNAALTNGFRFYYKRDGEEVDIHDAVKTNSDLIRMCIVDHLPTAWELRNVAVNGDYGYLVTLDTLNLMPPYGLKLDRGTTQKLVWEVRDDNTDADVMNLIAYGFDRFE